MEEYLNWKGTRVELLNIINLLEKKEPNKYLMNSKKLKKKLPVSMRRIQDFIDKGILPAGELENKSYIYSAEHLFRYFAAIILKNSDHTLVQIGKILSIMQLEEIIDKFLDSESLLKDGLKNSNSYLIQKSNLPEKLKKLGREEGRVLRSQWIKFAITKWCHLEVKKKELKNLTAEDIDTLAYALKETLSMTSKIKDIDRSIG